MTLKWVVWSRKAIEKSELPLIKQLINEYKNLEWRPKLKRWNDICIELYTNLIRNSNHNDLINEWKLEVLKDTAIAFRSRIARVENGRELTKAWKFYYKGQYDQSINLIETISDNVSIIKKLKTILLAMIYIKTMRIYSINTLIFDMDDNDDLDGLMKLFNNYYKIIIGESSIDTHPISRTAVQNLPFLKEDIDLIFSLDFVIGKSYNVSNLVQYDNSINWIDQLLLYKVFENNRTDNYMQKEKLKKIIHTLPESPDKVKILGQLY